MMASAGIGMDKREPPQREPPSRRRATDDWSRQERYFQRTYREASYYSSGRDWSDYQPAYRYGYDNYPRYRGRHFEEVESLLERHWAASRDQSRLAWTEARGAVRDIWQRIEQALPGGRDRH